MLLFLSFARDFVWGLGNSYEIICSQIYYIMLLGCPEQK